MALRPLISHCLALMITVAVLAENTARGAGILGEHELAWWIDTGTDRISPSFAQPSESDQAATGPPPAGPGG